MRACGHAGVGRRPVVNSLASKVAVAAGTGDTTRAVGSRLVTYGRLFTGMGIGPSMGTGMGMSTGTGTSTGTCMITARSGYGRGLEHGRRNEHGRGHEHGYGHEHGRRRGHGLEERGHGHGWCRQRLGEHGHAGNHSRACGPAGMRASAAAPSAAQLGPEGGSGRGDRCHHSHGSLVAVG